MQVKYKYHSGDDLSVVNAARVSFSKESFYEQASILDINDNWVDIDTLSDKDEKLINFLARNNHWTPFSHTSITLHIKAPIFIRTQCFKHKVGFTENEVSRRYVATPPEFYVPDIFRSKAIDKKQGSGEALTEEINDSCNLEYISACNTAVEAYKALLKLNVAPEIARAVLPQSTYTEWYWTGSLSAYARFYNLRSKSDAQKEIRDLAEMIKETIEPLYPVSWSALTDYKFKELSNEEE